jgi:cytochrome oxidase Cu insertion factor (SCO1/SenC/PrrC family)
MERHKRDWILGGIGVCLLAGAAVLWASNRQPPPASPLSPFAAVHTAARTEVPVLFESPPFDFVDQDGKRTTQGELRGKIWIADFIFTHCAGSCPKVTAAMVELQKAIEDPDVRFVSFSVDPDRDDPRTLKDYAATNNTGEDRWMLLRPPDRKAVTLVAQRMAALAHSADPKDTILHTDFFILIDQNGHVRGLYDSKDRGALERLKADVNTIARQRAMEKIRSETGTASTRGAI